MREGTCLGKLLIEKMKSIGGHIEFCKVTVHGYTSGVDDKGVLRFVGFYTDENGDEIKIDPEIDFLDRKKFYDKNGREIDEPRIVLPTNVIYGPNT